MAEVANELDCCTTTVKRWMDKHDMDRRNRGAEAETTTKRLDSEKKYRNKTWLKEQYWKEESTLEEMADLSDTSMGQLIKHMDRHNIDRRKPQQGNNYASVRTVNTGHEVWQNWDGYEHGHCTVAVHRLLMVAEHGFDALKGKDVHHINHIPWDNRPGNLELMDWKKHRTHHAKTSS